jgi:hypothetical protein
MGDRVGGKVREVSTDLLEIARSRRCGRRWRGCRRWGGHGSPGGETVLWRGCVRALASQVLAGRRDMLAPMDDRQPGLVDVAAFL